jgi:MinD-like ATPase involved in chromosome partitioning or flagellar assembly
MLIFATSDKGGTGRSVTGCNLAYRLALQGNDVCYVDFDFGSPTAGAIFELGSATTGAAKDGLHSLLNGRITEPARLNVWLKSDRKALRDRPAGAGQLVLFPGNSGGGEFPSTPDVTRRCKELFLRLEEEFDICFIDLSAGRSHALDMSLDVTADTALRSITARWVVFHRWTRQHIVAAANLVYGELGLLKTGEAHGHDVDSLLDSVRFVRTAMVNPNAASHITIAAAQAAWLEQCHRDLTELARKRQLGSSVVLGETPMDPVLQWREQLICDTDVDSHVANPKTVEALDELASRLTNKASWAGL